MINKYLFPTNFRLHVMSFAQLKYRYTLLTRTTIATIPSPVKVLCCPEPPVIVPLISRSLT